MKPPLTDAEREAIEAGYETPEQTAEWQANEKRLALMAYWQECGDALANQQAKRREIPAYPPPCDWMTGDEGQEL